MFPQSSVSNSRNGSESNSVDGRRFVQRQRQVSNFFDVFFRQFVVWIASSNHIFRTFLSFSVSHILLMCPKKQMLWIHTPRIVALVTDAKADRNFSEMNYPRKSMSSNLDISRKIHSSIAARSICRPVPAFGYWINKNARPKTINIPLLEAQ